MRIAIIPAAGIGSRAGGVIPKQYQRINGVPMLLHTLRAFSTPGLVDEVIVVVSKDDQWIDTLDDVGLQITVLRCGGETRAQTVRNALCERADVCGDSTWVLVHDAARCCVSLSEISELIAACERDAVGGLLALPVPDTVKQADESSRVEKTVDRKKLWLAQTPQMFRLGVLRDALVAAKDVTDEASAIEAVGLAPILVRGSAQNFKVTYPEDFALAAAILGAKPAA